MVFQNYALYPHMSSSIYGLWPEAAEIRQAEIKKRVGDAASFLN